MTNDGMNLARSNSSSISGNLVQKCSNMAIVLLELSGVTVEDNTIVNSKGGLWTSDATSLFVR